MWYAFCTQNQTLLSIDEKYEIEHIYARNRYNKERGLTEKVLLDKLGNKSIIEKRINIRATDYAFVDKKKYYKGFTTVNGNFKEGTNIFSLLELSNLNEFNEMNIKERNNKIVNDFIDFLFANSLIKN